MAEPRNPFAGWSDDEMERALRELGRRLALPPTPDLAVAVRSATAQPSAVTRREVRRFPVRRVLAAAAIVVMALVAGLVLSGGFRSTVADFFGVRGVRIVIERETPTATATANPAPTPNRGPEGTPPNVGGGEPPASPVASPRVEGTPVGTGLLLGRRVTLAEARAAVPYQIHVPTLGSLGEPDEIYLRTLPDGNQMVSFIYLPAPGLPETLETGVGVLLMQFEARDNIDYLAKSMAIDTPWSIIEINDHRSLWIEGAHQLTLLPDPSSGCCGGNTRPAGNVLLWEQDGLTFRLESSLNEDDAVAIAESVTVPKATPGAGTGN
jgi:hypothetical protein